MKFLDWLVKVLDAQYIQWVFLALMIVSVFTGTVMGVAINGVFWLEARAVLLSRTKLVIRVEEALDRKMSLHADCCES